MAFEKNCPGKNAGQDSEKRKKMIQWYKIYKAILNTRRCQYVP